MSVTGKQLAALLFCVSFLAGGSVARAGDAITLKDGTRVEGKIVEETENCYVMQVWSGSISMRITYAKGDVKTVEKADGTLSPEEAILKGLDRTNPESYMTAIRELEEKGFIRQAKKLKKELEEFKDSLWHEINARWLCLVCQGGRIIPCDNCNGTGFVTYEKECSTCHGKGTVRCEHCKSGWSPCPGDCLKSGPHKGMIRKYRKDKFGQKTMYFETCWVCDGKGVKKCRRCRGRGVTKCKKCKAIGKVKEKILCRKCKGTGRMTCPACHGTGIDEKKRALLRGK